MAFNPFSTLFNAVRREVKEFGQEVRGGIKNVKEIVPENKFIPSDQLFEDVVRGIPEAGQELRTEFLGGFRSGILSAAGAIETIGSIGLKKVGIDQVAEKLRTTARKDFELAQVGIDVQDKRKFSEKIQDPTFIARGMGQNLPNFLAAMGVGVVGGLVAGPPGAILGALTTAGVLEAGFAFEEAKRFNVPDDKAEKIAITVGIINGILESIPITRLLRRIPAGKQVKDKIIRKATTDVIIQAGQESGTESLQEIVSNVVASTYDENRKLFADIPEAAFFGALIGGGASIAFDTVSTIPVGLTTEEIPSEIPRRLGPLIPEARKYKSAGEFVKSRPEIKEIKEEITELENRLKVPDLRDDLTSNQEIRNRILKESKKLETITSQLTELFNQVKRITPKPERDLIKEITSILEEDELRLKRKEGQLSIEDIKLPKNKEEFRKLSEEEQNEVFGKLDNDLQEEIMGVRMIETKVDRQLIRDIRKRGGIRFFKGIELEEELQELPINIKRRTGKPLDEMADELAEEGYPFKDSQDLLSALKGDFVRKFQEVRDIASPARKSKEFRAIPESLKNKIMVFFRPSRKLRARAFQLLGNKDTTIPLLANLFDSWVKGGVKTIIEPYAGAYTIGAHGMNDAFNSGLKNYYTNIFDKEKYIIVDAIQNGKVDRAIGLIQKSVDRLSQTILDQSTGKEREVLVEFFKGNPESYIGSKKFYSFIIDKPIGKKVTVFGDEQEAWRKIFQDAYTKLFKEEVTNLESAVMNSVIKRTGLYGGKGQPLIGQTGFRSFQDILFGKFGMAEGFRAIDDSFRLAETKGVRIVIGNEDGAEFIKSINTDPKTTAYYFDPPYVLSGDVYNNADNLSNFASGDAFVRSHKKAFDDANEGARMALTNDIEEGWLNSMEDSLPGVSFYAYKEGNTPTSLTVDIDSGPIIDIFLAKETPARGGEREEISRIKAVQIEKGLSIATVSRARKNFGIKELKNATDNQLDEFLLFLESLEYGDKFLTPLQLDSLTQLLGVRKWDKPNNLLTQREVMQNLGESTEIMDGILTHYISNNAFPTVDIKQGHPIITRIVNNADIERRASLKRIKAINEELVDLLQKAKKSRKQGIRKLETGKMIFKRMSGDTTAELTDAENETAIFLKNYFEKTRKELNLKKYRRNYITNIEKTLFEKVFDEGIFEAAKDFRRTLKITKENLPFKQRDLDLPLDIMLALDNIIGSEKFFRFALERKGGIDPTTDIERLFLEYSRITETKKYLDKVLPEAQAAQQLLLQPKSAIWMKNFLQNLKGRGLDHGFRTGKMRWVSRSADIIVDFSYLRLLGLNIKATVANLVGGEVNSFLVLPLSSYLLGKKRLLLNPYKSYKLISEFGVLDGSFVDLARTSIKKKLTRITDKIAFSPMQSAEYEIRGSFFLGSLTSEEWKTGKITTERFREILDGIAISQGLYTPTDSPLFVQTVVGRAAIQFGRWKITNSLLVRRLVKGAKTEISEGEKLGPNTRKLIQILIITGLGMYLEYEFAKMGWKIAERGARASSELFLTIVDILTAKTIYETLTRNPFLDSLSAFTFSMQSLAHYISGGIIDEPRTIEFNRGIEDLYISAFNQIDLKKNKTESIMPDIPIIPLGPISEVSIAPTIEVPIIPLTITP